MPYHFRKSRSLPELGLRGHYPLRQVISAMLASFLLGASMMWLALNRVTTTGPIEEFSRDQYGYDYAVAGCNWDSPALDVGSDQIGRLLMIRPRCRIVAGYPPEWYSDCPCPYVMKPLAEYAVIETNLLWQHPFSLYIYRR